MSLLKFPLLPEGKHFVAGYTNLKSCLNRPLDVGGCTVFVCKSGKADILFSFKQHNIKAGQVIVTYANDRILTPIQVSEDFEIFHFTTSTDISDDVFYKTSSDLYDFFHFNPILSTTREMHDLLDGWEKQIMWMISAKDQTNIYRFISNSLCNFLLVVETMIRSVQSLSDNTYKRNRKWTLINKFANLLLEHGDIHKDVNFYADKLCITPCYLYKVVSKELDISPKEMIEHYTLQALKILLSTTDLSMKEIAEKLNFEDPSYLNRFFRKHVGITLTDFRASQGSTI